MVKFQAHASCRSWTDVSMILGEVQTEAQSDPLESDASKIKRAGLSLTFVSATEATHPFAEN
jgi:hypothetical protein